MELIAVLIIVGILAVVGNTQFSASRERALGKEAQSNLKLIQTAERIYKLEQGSYWPTVTPEWDLSDINSALKLFLNDNNWAYGIVSAGANSFTARARRQGSGGYLDCEYDITESGSEPSHNSDCPQ